MAARSGSQPKRWGLGVKVGVAVLCVALIAAVAIGLGVGLSNGDGDDSPPSVSQRTAGSTTAIRIDGTQTGTPGSGASGDTNSTKNGTCGSILDVVTEIPELSTLLSLLQSTGLNETLSDDELEYTLLAPSNSVLNTVSTVPPVVTLTNILQFHIVTSSVSAASLVDGAYLATLTGTGFLNVSLSEDRATFLTADGASNATVIEADLKSCKGYVHVIDNILLTAELQVGLGSPGSDGAYPLTRNLGPTPTFKLNVDNFEQDLVSLLGSGWMFYEAQQSGRLSNSTPPNRISWRGDSYINDGAAENRDLSGGWYDAGDTLKLSMPFCSTVWRLAWNLITFKEVTQAVRFNEQPIHTNGLRQLAHAAKYLEKMHTTNNTLVAAVGDLRIDHLIADDRPLVGEQFLGANVSRPVIMLNQTSGGADLIAEACSAFAALGILFREQDPAYSNVMIKHARQLYDWMVLVPGTQYSRVHPMLHQLYPSAVPHAHMMLAAAWMFRLTGESKFESAASSFHHRGREQQINPIVGWNNPLQDAKLLLLEANPNSETTWLPGLQEWVDSQMFGDSISYSPKGLWYAHSYWGVLRNAANMASIAMRTAAMVDRFGSTTDDAHMVVWAHHARCLARQQMNYIMGSSGRSFVTGWGKNPPKRPHHRGAACAFVEEGQNCTGATWTNPNLSFPNTLPGGLVGGPTQFDEFRDSHLDFIQSEVSLEFNAALVSAVSSMTAMPAHFWTNTNFCPMFPIPKVKWLDITVKPVPGVALPDTPDDGALIL